MDAHDADDPKQSTADMTAFLSAKSSPADVGEMGNRIEELENSINDLRAEMGVESSPSASTPLKPQVEAKSGNDSGKE